MSLDILLYFIVFTIFIKFGFHFISDADHHKMKIGPLNIIVYEIINKIKYYSYDVLIKGFIVFSKDIICAHEHYKYLISVLDVS